MKTFEEFNKTNKEYQKPLMENTIVLWANKVDNNLAKAIKKAKYIGKSSSDWDPQYKINAKNGHGTVFFVDAENVKSAKEKIQDVSDEHKEDTNIYIVK